jgi:hypothetical protein
LERDIKYLINYPCEMNEEKVSLFAERIRDFLSEDEFSLELAERYCYVKDVSPIDVSADVLPDVIVWPKTSEQVSNLVKVASEMSIPVIPRGAGARALCQCGGLHYFVLQRRSFFFETTVGEGYQDHPWNERCWHMADTLGVG